MSEQTDRWCALASRLGFNVTAPATIRVGDDDLTFTGLLPQFGGRSGMIVDPHWEAIGPHAAAFTKLGYGFSSVELTEDLDPESSKEMLREWGWTAAEPKPS